MNWIVYKCFQMFETVLSELEPVCLAEQDFCVKFFLLAINIDVSIASQLP